MLYYVRARLYNLLYLCENLVPIKLYKHIIIPLFLCILSVVKYYFELKCCLRGTVAPITFDSLPRGCGLVSQSMCQFFRFCILTYCLSFCLGQCTVLLSAHALIDPLSNSNGDIPCQLNTKK